MRRDGVCGLGAQAAPPPGADAVSEVTGHRAVAGSRSSAQTPLITGLQTGLTGWAQGARPVLQGPHLGSVRKSILEPK